VAGGQRLASLHYLAKRGDIEENCPVPCLEKFADADLTEISLAENIHTAMHPADQFLAYSRLVDEGLSVDEIALRFGVAKTLVSERLALGKVVLKLLDHYRHDKFSLECLMAFTVCEDTKRQLACYKVFSQNPLRPHRIKSWLLGEAYVLSKGMGKFLGKTAYLKAGGVLSRDLLEDETYLSDSALVEELAKQRLQREAGKLRKNDCWSWIEINAYCSKHCSNKQTQPSLGSPFNGKPK
jgi:ParB family chromosome partitioning protein